MAEDQKNQGGADKGPWLFESRYPGLQMHLKEVKDADGVRSLKAVNFKPAAVALDAPHGTAKGHFTTSDPALADTLRGHKHFNKSFREIVRGQKGA